MSTINQIVKATDGTIMVRILKSSGGWHRTSIPPDVDIDAQMIAVNTDLERLGCTPVSDIQAIKDARG